jgi:hypothetical protein
VRDLVIERLSNTSHQKSGLCGLFIVYVRATGSLEKGRLIMKLEATLGKSESMVDFMRNIL